MSPLFKGRLARLKRGTAAWFEKLKVRNHDTTSEFQELKKDFEPLKPLFQFLVMAVSSAIAIVRMWPDYPKLALIWLISLAAGAVLFLVGFFEVPVIGALRGAENDARTNATRNFLLTFFAVASVFLFIFAIVADDSSAPSFFAGALGIVALLAARAHFAVRNTSAGRWSSLVDSLTEPLLIFTATAAIFAIATAVLDYKVDSGNMTLAQLESLDRSALRGRMFFNRVHFPGVTAFALAALMVLLRWLEGNWTPPAAPAQRKARMSRPVMKWAARLAFAALFIASFSFLVARQREPLLAAGLRDFNNYYSRFQDKVEERIEPAFKRDLIASAWTRLDKHGRSAIREAVGNRKALQSMEDGYQALAELGFHDQQTESMISEMRTPDFTKENSPSHPRLTQERARPPATLQEVSLRTVRLANIVEFQSKKGPVPEESEEVREMDSVVRIGLRDIVTDGVIHQRLYHWLDIHFPGLDDILNSIKDADRESMTNLEEARDQVIRRNLTLPRSVLDDLVADEAHAGAARVPLHSPHVTERSRNISAEGDRIHRAEVLLHREAPKVIASALQGSRTRTQHMVTQMQKLNELHPILELFSNNQSEYRPESPYKRAARQITYSQEARPQNLEKLKPFADPRSIDELSRQLSNEQYDENLLAVLVGRDGSEFPEMKTILGSEVDKYEKIYDAWLDREIASLRYSSDD